mgnify:CR=1 FL=1
MRTTQSKFDFRIRRVRKYSDLAIIEGATHTTFWRMLFLKEAPKAWFELALQYKQFLAAQFAFVQNAIFHFRFGAWTYGFIILLFANSTIMTFNSTEVPIILKPIVAPFAILTVFFVDLAEFKALIFDKVHSVFLMALMHVFNAFAIIHILSVYMGFGNKSLTKRGESWLFNLFSLFCKPGQYFVCGILEPAIMIASGVWVHQGLGDIYGAVFLWICAAAVIMQEIEDKSVEMKNRSMLNL